MSSAFVLAVLLFYIDCCFDGTGSSSGNALGLYLEGARFESRLRYRLKRLMVFVVFCSLHTNARIMPPLDHDSVLLNTFPFINYHTIQRYEVSIQHRKTPHNENVFITEIYTKTCGERSEPCSSYWTVVASSGDGTKQ
jgi:hypothetical protein